MIYMRKLTAMMLAVILLSLHLICLSSCEGGDGGDNPPVEPNPDPDSMDTIVVPEYKDYGRGTVNFSDIYYSRPDIDGAIASFDAVSDSIDKNEIDYGTQLASINSLEECYNNILTMSAYATVFSSKNTADEYWTSEDKFITTKYPSFSQAVERLFVSAANSPHAEKFEEDYFGNDLIEKYRGGGRYTDELVSLMASEAALEADYSVLSEATVTVTYNGKTDTYSNIIKFYEETYGHNAAPTVEAKKACAALYESELNRISGEIMVDLFRLRGEISDALGYDSYSEFAYENIYHDYSEDEFISFAEGIADYILPVYVKLSNYIFNQYQTSDLQKTDVIPLINNTYKMMEKADSDLFEIYSYMLQHGLYEISGTESTRFNGAFTTYLDTYSAPFIFMSASGDASDYMTLCHEFGHFADAYMNDNDQTSMDLAEVSSQAFEMLSLTKLNGVLSSSTVKTLTVYELERSLSAIVFQAFYAMFEHYAYQIPYENVSRETLGHAVSEAASFIGLNSAYLNDVYYVMIPHLFLYPFYVQSYCTSAAVSLDIYFTELEDEGEGLAIYKDLIDRGEDELTFVEHLTNAGLDSPFNDNYLRDIANKVHFKLLGSYYFSVENSDAAAA